MCAGESKESKVSTSRVEAVLASDSVMLQVSSSPIEHHKGWLLLG